MGMRTGQGKSWTARRVGALRTVHGIHAYRSAVKDGEWLTMSEAAKALGVNRYIVRRLIRGQVLAAEQVVRGAPYQIKASDLLSEQVAAALEQKVCPRRGDDQSQLPMFSVA